MLASNRPLVPFLPPSWAPAMHRTDQALQGSVTGCGHKGTTHRGENSKQHSTSRKQRLDDSELLWLSGSAS